MRKSSVKGAAIVFALTLLMSLCACGENEAPGTGDQGTTDPANTEQDDMHSGVNALTPEQQIDIFAHGLSEMMKATDYAWSSACVTDMDNDGALELALRYRTQPDVYESSVVEFYRADAQSGELTLMDVNREDPDEYFSEQYCSMIYEDPNGVRHYVFQSWNSGADEDDVLSVVRYDDVVVSGNQIDIVNISSEKFWEHGEQHGSDCFDADGTQISREEFVCIQQSYFSELLGDYTMRIAVFTEITFDAFEDKSEEEIAKTLASGYGEFLVNEFNNPLTYDTLEGEWMLTGGEVEGDVWSASELGYSGTLSFEADHAAVSMRCGDSADAQTRVVIADEQAWGGGLRMAYLYGAEAYYDDLTVSLRDENTLDFSFTVYADDGTFWGVTYLFERA